MKLDELFDYKNQLMMDLATNEEIVKLLDDSNEMVENPTELIYKRIFPYEYVPEIVEEGHSFICFDVDIQSSLNKTYYLPAVYVWVFTHKNKLRLEEGGVRPDKICSAICEAINGSRYYGLGELDLSSVKRFSPMQDYQGKVMTFQTIDFNRSAPSGKPVPSNRKRG